MSTVRSRVTPVGRGDVIALFVGIGVLVLSAAAAAAPLTGAETQAFRVVNDLPDSLYPFVWPLMQYGTFITIPALTLVAIAIRRYRAAAALAVSGIGVYLLARVVKAAVERGRPGSLLADVHAREVFGEGSLGFPSGHAAVAAALAFTGGIYFGGWAFWVGVALAIVVSLGRLYVGAHLPLDVIGGAALGIIAGSVAHMVIGIPHVKQPLVEAEQLTDEGEGADGATPSS